MKNLQIILFSIVMGFSITINAQLIVDSQGHVGIGSSFNSNTNVTVPFEINANFTGGGVRFKNYWGPLVEASWNNKGRIGRWNNKWEEFWVKTIHADVYTGSDIRIKENIRPIENALKKLMQINTINYDLKASYYKGSDPESMNDLIDEGKGQFGVIAQELKEIFPKLVRFNKEADLFSVNYIGLIPILIRAVQDQQSMIEKLENKIKGLESGKTGIQMKSKDNETIKYSSILYNNQPNPFRNNTVIHYYLAENDVNSQITINVYDQSGNIIKCISLNNSLGKGEVQVSTDDIGKGIFIYSLSINGVITDSKTMICVQ